MNVLLGTLLSLSSLLPITTLAQQRVFTDDIDHFWTAYDSVKTTANHAQQVAFMTSLYVERQSPGLAAFMKARDYSAAHWVELIHRYPKFWTSIRPNTLTVKQQAPAIESSIRAFRKLYPELREARLYFTIGGLRSGGTVEDQMVLIGTEIATANAQTDVSEFTDPWLATVFQQQSLDNVVALNLHEYVHTQQRSGNERGNVLTQALKEGSCDFITELVTGRPLRASYAVYGAAHEPELRTLFEQDMFSQAYGAWLYNGTSSPTTADLGYYMGYVICKAYYNKIPQKKQAIKDIIELNYADSTAVERFVQRSGYYAQPWNKAALAAAFAAKQPVLVTTHPVVVGNSAVDASLKELVIHFDREMNRAGVSFAPGPRGKNYFPLQQPVGFSADGRSYTVQVALEPHHEYEFIVTKRGFKSKQGYALRQDYPIHFRTR
ncbi:hypothetical protein [Hymenobacter sp. YC55]|uniref:hypothetical protein n=1 Tax=Hymenobacter sp. YC55 TaxID=3034019 RepID=UPI0023F752D2|nr:hypothetical protein [Hymenobacter sp. YC55]MDF7815231.1 hypothetical protein [Hymenobacter sp. YC55]